MFVYILQTCLCEGPRVFRTRAGAIEAFRQDVAHYNRVHRCLIEVREREEHPGEQREHGRIEIAYAGTDAAPYLFHVCSAPLE